MRIRDNKYFQNAPKRTPETLPTHPQTIPKISQTHAKQLRNASSVINMSTVFSRTTKIEKLIKRNRVCQRLSPLNLLFAYVEVYTPHIQHHYKPFKARKHYQTHIKSIANNIIFYVLNSTACMHCVHELPAAVPAVIRLLPSQTGREHDSPSSSV